MSVSFPYLESVEILSALLLAALLSHLLLQLPAVRSTSWSDHSEDSNTPLILQSSCAGAHLAVHTQKGNAVAMFNPDARASIYSDSARVLSA